MPFYLYFRLRRPEQNDHERRDGLFVTFHFTNSFIQYLFINITVIFEYSTILLYDVLESCNGFFDENVLSLV